MRKLSESEKQELREKLQNMGTDRLTEVAKRADKQANRFSLGASILLAWFFFPVGIILGIIFIMRDREREGAYMLFGALGVLLLSITVRMILRMTLGV